MNEDESLTNDWFVNVLILITTGRKSNGFFILSILNVIPLFCI